MMLCFVLLLLCGSCADDDVSKAAEVKEYVAAVMKNDSSVAASGLKAGLDSLDPAEKHGVESIYAAVNDYVRKLLSTGRHSDAIVMMERQEGILMDGSRPDVTGIKQLLNIYVCLGAAYDETGMPGIGLDYYSRGLALASDSVFDKYRAMLYNNIGVLYSRGGRNDKAEQYFRNALHLNLKLRHRKEIFLNYNNLAATFSEEGNLKKALDASLNGLQYISAEENPADFYSTQILLGSLYSRNRDMKMARSYLENGLAHLDSINFVPGRVEACQQLARHYLNVGRLDSACNYALRAMTLSDSTGLTPLEIFSLEILSDLHIARGDYGEAVRVLKRCGALKDSVRTEESRMRLTEWEKNNLRDKSKVGTVDASSTSAWKICAWVLILLFIIVAVAAAIVYNIYKRREKTLKNREAGLAAEIDRLNREMTCVSLDRVKEHEGIESITEDLAALFSEMTMKNTGQSMRSRSLIARLNHISDSATDEFRHYFEKVHPDFYRTLETRYPELTTRDIRLCAFLLLGLSTKEIASITSREVRSVESARNRLRKKLLLDPTADIAEFLRTLH